MSEIALTQPAETSATVSPLADCSPAEQIERRYLNAVDALVDDAIEHDSSRILADVLTWSLARMVVG